MGYYASRPCLWGRTLRAEMSRGDSADAEDGNERSRSEGARTVYPGWMAHSGMPALVALLEGRRVRQLRRVLYVGPDGERNDFDGALEITVDGGTTVLLFGGPRADGMRWEEGRWADPFAEPLSPENRAFVKPAGRWGRVRRWRLAWLRRCDRRGDPVSMRLRQFLSEPRSLARSLVRATTSTGPR
jgi:hypothetical protein